MTIRDGSTKTFYVSFLEFLAPQAMKRDAETVVCFKIRNAKKNGAKKKRGFSFSVKLDVAAAAANISC